MRKILIVSDDFYPFFRGGAGYIAYLQAKALTEKKFKVFVFTTNQGKKNYKIKGISIRSAFSPLPLVFRKFLGLANPFILPKFANYLEELKPDLIHFHNIHTSISYYAVKIANKFTNKLFITFHDLMFFYGGKVRKEDIKTKKNNLLIKIRMSLIKDCRKICVSNALKEAYEKSGLKIDFVLHNFIETTEYKNIKLEKNLRKKYTTSRGKTALIAGRLNSPMKGLPLLEKAIKGTKTILLAVGINKKNKKNVIYIPWLDRKKMNLIYSLVDFVIVPSNYIDPLPTVVLEAMSNAKPVIGTIFGGTKEMIKDNYNGYLINPNNISGLRKKIILLSENEKVVKLFGKNGFTRYKKYFSKDVLVKKLINIYNDFN